MLSAETATCFIVPPSFKIIWSASTMVTDEALVSPSMMFISEAVAVTPSSMFNSAAVDVTFVPPISKVVIDTSPLTVKVEPSNVKFASPFRPLEPSAVTTRLLLSFAIVTPADQDKFPDPSVVNDVPELPSAAGKIYVLLVVTFGAEKPT